MPNYRRPVIPGATVFVTLVTHDRRPLFSSSDAQALLRQAILLTRKDRPFQIEEIVLLPDHLHLAITLPQEDSDLSTRIAAIKARFTSSWIKTGHVESQQSFSRLRQAYRGVWQKRFWDHIVRDQDDLNRIREYIWYNPVKHGLVACPHAWPASSFHQAVRRTLVDTDWQCTCHGATSSVPLDIPGAEMDL